MAVSSLLRFGPFTFEPHTGALWRETERLPLQPQDAAVLHSLLQQAGRVVRTEALLDAVWPETSVSETGLQHRINRLRQLLGDDPKRPQYIETRHGQDYRFLGLPLGLEAGAEAMPRTDRPSAAAVGLADDTFIGREPELATLHAALADATAGHGRIVLLAGEPGGRQDASGAGTGRLRPAARRPGVGRALLRGRGRPAVLAVGADAPHLCHGL
jgi:Transcriptional regulatory protein, C terminal